MPTGFEAGGTVRVAIGGAMYEEFLSVNLKRSMEEQTCSGTIVLSWPGTEHMGQQGLVASDFIDGADGQILLDGQLAAEFVIDTRISKGSPKSYELTLQFRGKCAVLVDTSPDHETGQENQKTAREIIQKMIEGTGINMIDMSATMKQTERFIIAEGETRERAIRRAAREVDGLVTYEDRQGNLVLAGKDGAWGSGADIILGRDFTHWSVKRDLSPRMARYMVFGNSIPTDKKYGKLAESLLSDISRDMGSSGGGAAGRMLRVPVDGDHDQGSMQNRGETEGDRRSGQGLNVTVRCPTWVDAAGAIWDIGTKHHVVIPIDGVDDALQLFEIEFEITPDSRSATLVLVSEKVLSPSVGGQTSFFDGIQQQDQALQQEYEQRYGAPYSGGTGNVPPPTPPREGQPHQLPETAIPQP